jgi:hypothetical protein
VTCKKKKQKLRILSPRKIGLKIESEIKSFSDKQKRRKAISSRSVLQQILLELGTVACTCWPSYSGD